MTLPLDVGRVGVEWCLFLDRDGVINRRIKGDYVRTWEQFEFLPGAESALAVLTNWAPHTVILTNQQGVGKGVMSRQDLDGIHDRMLRAIRAASGRVDAVLACVHLEAEQCDCRKPRPGLAVRWLAEHPTVRGDRSVMVGDSRSDLLMARKLAEVTGGCAAVMLGDAPEGELSDLRLGSLAELAAVIVGEPKGASEWR